MRGVRWEGGVPGVVGSTVGYTGGALPSGGIGIARAQLMDPGPDTGSRARYRVQIQGPDTGSRLRFQDSDSRTQIPGLSSQIPGLSSQIPGLSIQGPRVSIQGPRVSIQGPKVSISQLYLSYI